MSFRHILNIATHLLARRTPPDGDVRHDVLEVLVPEWLWPLTHDHLRTRE